MKWFCEVFFQMIANAKTKRPSTYLKLKKRKKTSSFSSSANGFFAKGSFIVINDKGLHTRPSTELVKCATSFKAEVHLIYQEFVVNAKSLLGILTLAATRGSCIQIQAQGEDAAIAVKTILELAQNKFYIHY